MRADTFIVESDVGFLGMTLKQTIVQCAPGGAEIHGSHLGFYGEDGKIVATFRPGEWKCFYPSPLVPVEEAEKDGCN